MLQRYWSVIVVVVAFVIAAFLLWLSVEASDIRGDISYDRYDGRPFFYWSLDYFEYLYLLAFPIGFLILLAFSARRKPKPGSVTRPVLLTMAVVSLFSCGLLFYFVVGIYEAPVAFHQSSIQVGDSTFHLGIIANMSGNDRYVLYRCDRTGFICTVVHSESRYYYGDTFETMRLIFDIEHPDSIVSLEVDGEIVYTYSSPRQSPFPYSTLEAMWQETQSLPPFLTDFTRIAGQSGYEQDICVGINEAQVWEAGDYSSDVYNHIRTTAQVTFDGIPVEQLSVYGLTILIARYDEQRNMIGSHGGGTYVCFDTPYAAAGLHLASIQFSSTSGIAYTHAWAVEVP